MMNTFFAELTAETIQARAADDAIVFMPVASTEQHGPHLPAGTDTMLVTEVVRRAARRLVPAQPVLILPTQWLGISTHHMPHGGTLTASFDAFRETLFAVTASLAHHGFRRFFIVNGHGGNGTAIRTIARELTEDLDVPVAATTYWSGAGTLPAEVLEAQGGIRHAGEAETSMMLALAPDLVQTDRLDDATGASPSLPRGVYRFRTMLSRTRSGVIGDARPATAEKGAALLEHYAALLAQKAMSEAVWAQPGS